MRLWNVVKAAPFAWKAVALVSVALGGYVGLLRIQNARLQRQLQVESLRAENEAARADITRLLFFAQQDTTRIWVRLAIQEEQRGDSLDRLVKKERRLQANLRVQLDSMVKVFAGAPTTDSGDVRRGTFEGYDRPFTIRAEALLPPPPAPGQLKLQLAIDPMTLQIRVHCGSPGVSGVRSAQFTVTAPSWAQVQLGTLSQAPEVCMPELAKPAGGKFKQGALAGAAAILLLHFLIGVP